MPRILIVDDDPFARSMLQSMLTDAGYEVHEASNGREALGAYGERPADVVILDVLMPEMEGLETIQRLKQMDPDVSVIAISGGGRYGLVEHLRLAEGLGAVRTFYKPLDNGKLLAALRDLTGNSGREA
jgi:CheY-like chemotaxis protein